MYVNGLVPNSQYYASATTMLIPKTEAPMEGQIGATTQLLFTTKSDIECDDCRIKAYDNATRKSHIRTERSLYWAKQGTSNV